MLDGPDSSEQVMWLSHTELLWPDQEPVFQSQRFDADSALLVEVDPGTE